MLSLAAVVGQRYDEGRDARTVRVCVYLQNTLHVHIFSFFSARCFGKAYRMHGSHKIPHPIHRKYCTHHEDVLETTPVSVVQSASNMLKYYCGMIISKRELLEWLRATEVSLGCRS